MSVKRVATTELNHDNWDQDDPADQKEMGTYEPAPKEVLEKRVIKTARRRTQMNSNNEAKKSVFSGFGGFNKSQPSSFDFLAKLTDSKQTNGSSTASKNENTVSSSIFTNSSLVNKPSSGLFSSSVSNTAPKTTPAFGTATTLSLFGISSSSSTTTTSTVNSSPFTASKADSTVKDSPFNTTSSSSKTGGSQLKSSPNLIPSQVSSTIASTTNKALFSTSANSSGSTPFKIQSVSSTTTTNTFGTNSKASATKSESANDAKMTYYSKLKGLNESVSEWITKHVFETPLCILTPIFNDYQKYLKEIQEEYDSAGGDNSKKDGEKITGPAKSIAPFSSNLTPTSKTSSSLFSSTSSGSNSLFASKTAPVISEEKPSQPFSFGIQTTAPSTAATDGKTGSLSGFSFGIKAQTKASMDQPATSPFGAEKSAAPQFGSEKSTPSQFGSEKPKSSLYTSDNPTATPFSLSSNTSSSDAPHAAVVPFSFGLGQKFSFSPNTQQNAEITKEQKNENEDDDEPPKVEFTPVVEENSVFDKRCKIFIKKDGNFADKGVATLYIKSIDNSSKYQLLVRANTNLGNVLVNLVLASAIPTQRMGKNNVMMVCIPTPDAKPPPTPLLIRVKTSEEADELLETLDKYKA